MDSLIADLRYAVRSLRKSPGFALVAVLTLALGIGATTTMFSVVEGVLLRSLPFPGAGRLVDVFQTPAQYRRPGQLVGGNSPLSVYDLWRTAPAVFDGTAAYTGGDPVLLGRGPARRVSVWTVTAGFFPLLGARPVLGRSFAVAEDRPGAAPTAVLSHAFWVDEMGSDPHAVGETLTLDTTVYTIVGVMPESFRYPAGVEIWTNLGALLAGPEGVARASRMVYWTTARLVPGVTAAAAQARLDPVIRRAWATDAGARGWLPVVTPLRDYLTGEVRTPLLIMLGAVALVLLIACTNVASLALSRSYARQHQVAMRAALGAGRVRLMRGALAESLVVAVAGGGLGLIAAAWSVPAVVKLAGSELPRGAGISLNGTVLLAGLGTILLAALLAALLPAWQAARLPPAEVLKSGGQGRAAASRARLGGALIVGQLALTTVLLAGAALLLRSFAHLTSQRLGFDPDHVVVADVQLPATGYAKPTQRREYVRQALERLAAVPGVRATAAGSGIPLSPGMINVENRPGPGGPRPVELFISAVTPDFFRVFGIPLLDGRALEPADPDAIVIDSATAREFFPGENAIGRRLTLFGNTSRTVVGIVGSARQSMLPIPTPLTVYEAYSQVPSNWLHLLAVVRGDPARAVAAVRRAVQEVGPDVPVGGVEPMTALIAGELARQRLYALLLGAFAAMALVLAAVGIYGLASYGVSHRTREFGIRIALGAGAGRVLGLVLGRALALGAGGAALGLAGAFVATRTLRGLLYGVGPWDPVAFAGAALILFGITVAASWLPARRATKVDPVEALRSE